MSPMRQRLLFDYYQILIPKANLHKILYHISLKHSLIFNFSKINVKTTFEKYIPLLMTKWKQLYAKISQSSYTTQNLPIQLTKYFLQDVFQTYQNSLAQKIDLH